MNRFAFCFDKTEDECKDTAGKCILEHRSDEPEGTPVCVPNVFKMRRMMLSDIEIDQIMYAVSILLPLDSNNLLNSRDFKASVQDMYGVLAERINASVRTEIARRDSGSWSDLASRVAGVVIAAALSQGEIAHVIPLPAILDDIASRATADRGEEQNTASKNESLDIFEERHREVRRLFRDPKSGSSVALYVFFLIFIELVLRSVSDK